MQRTRFVGLFGAVLVASTIIAVAATPAVASDQHCAVLLVPSSIDPSGAILATQVDLGCYDTYADALAAGSSGAIHLPSEITPSLLTNAILAVASATNAPDAVLIGTEYNSSGYAGASQSYFAPVTCSTGVVWEVADVGATWDNRFQSGKGFGGCDTNKKFQNTNFGGNVLTCTPNCSDYGALSNQVSSLRWRS
jgi:hypothetical protein